MIILKQILDELMKYIEENKYEFMDSASVYEDFHTPIFTDEHKENLKKKIRESFKKVLQQKQLEFNKKFPYGNDHNEGVHDALDELLHELQEIETKVGNV